MRECWEKYPDAETPLKVWYRTAKAASWLTPADIKTQYRNASFVGNDRVVFNIAGNKYRLVVAVSYTYQALYIRFVGSMIISTRKRYEMEIKLIKTAADHEAALKEIDRFWNAELDTLEGDRLDILITLVEAWEDKHEPIDPPDPIEAIKYRMEEQGLTRKDMEPFLGSRQRVSDILNRKRPLSLTMIRKLNQGLGIPAEVLIQETKL